MSTSGKKEINLSDYKQSENDCGSAQYQIALLTQHITSLTEHLKVHKKDNSAIRGMKALVEQRKKHLKYLHTTSPSAFSKIIKDLNIRYRISQ
mgnify:CR=1 FL=1